MMKEGTGGKKEEDGGRNATGDGKVCPKDGAIGINPGAVECGREYFYFLSEQTISLLKITFSLNGCGVGESSWLRWGYSLVYDTTLEVLPGLY